MKNVNLSEEKINQLASDISNRLFESHYFNQGVIGGEALKNFSDYVQINKFLLFQVYQVWHIQISRFKHPYFDFEQGEVKDKLKQLQNLLSRNIAIKQEDFKPMLKKAVFNNLRLLISPEEALENFFFQSNDKIDLELYSRYVPFFTDFDFVVNSILRYHQKNGMKIIDRDVFKVKMARVLELYNEKSDQDVDTYRGLRFLQLTNKQLDEVMNEDQKEAMNRERDRKEKQEAEQAMLEAERKKKEALAKESEESFFDSLAPVGDNVFEIGDDDPVENPDKDVATAPLKSMSRSLDAPAEEVLEEKEAPEEAAPKEEPAAPVETAPIVGEDVVEEPAPVVEETKEAEVEEKSETIVEEAMTEVKTRADQFKEQASSRSTVLRRVNRNRSSKSEEDQNPSVLDKLAESKESEPVSRVLDKAQKEEPSKIKTTKEKTKEESPAKAKAEKPAKPKAKKAAPASKPKPEPKAKSEPVVEKKEPAKESAKADEKQATSILDKLKKSKESQPEDNKDEAPKTLVDRLRAEKGPAGENSPGGKKIQPDEIPIHKQYQFVQKVFGGNNIRFRIIVDKVNNSTSKEDLEDILNKYIYDNDEVDDKDSVVTEFVELLRKRY